MNGTEQTSEGIRSGAALLNESAILNHLLDRLNAGDGFFREREAKGDCTEKLAIDINRAAAHALDHAGLGQRAAAELGENDALFWSSILEDAEDLDLEIFDSVALEDSFSDAMLPGADILERKEGLSSRGSRSKQDWAEQGGQGKEKVSASPGARLRTR